jgi:NAD-dependent SIR2 family protein deacetylase
VRFNNVTYYQKMALIDESSRLMSFGEGLPKIPERLMLAHARGEVLFLVGAGVSRPDLPDFRGLVLSIYEEFEPKMYEVLSALPKDSCVNCYTNFDGLTPSQRAEANRFTSREFDVVLGLLERRLDGFSGLNSSIRKAVASKLRQLSKSSNNLHDSLVRLANRGGCHTVLTTNFDLLLEAAAKKGRIKIASHSLGAIPRPSRGIDFSGIMHIHGAIHQVSNMHSDLVLTDLDFGEYYLRRRVIPDLIYDAARLFHIVLVGYSANDPPMKYLLNAVAADGVRFENLKERFVFVGNQSEDLALMEDWKGRGITPIGYDNSAGHKALHDALSKWADMSNIGISLSTKEEKELKKFFKSHPSQLSDEDGGLLDFLIRRSDSADIKKIALIANSVKAAPAWLDYINNIYLNP